MPAPHAFHKIVRRSDPHEIAGCGRRKPRQNTIEHGEHDRLRLADREAAHSVAIEPDLGQRFGAIHPQGLYGAALNDTKQGPAGLGNESRLRALRPSQRQEHGPTRF